MQANLQDCTFCELYCSDCNSKFRLVPEDESAASQPHPECGVAAQVEIVGKGQTIRELPFSQFLHRGRVRLVDTLLFFGTPRQRLMKFRSSLPEAQRIHAGTG